MVLGVSFGETEDGEMLLDFWSGHIMCKHLLLSGAVVQIFPSFDHLCPGFVPPFPGTKQHFLSWWSRPHRLIDYPGPSVSLKYRDRCLFVWVQGFQNITGHEDGIFIRRRRHFICLQKLRNQRYLGWEVSGAVQSSPIPLWFSSTWYRLWVYHPSNFTFRYSPMLSNFLTFYCTFP